MSVKTSKFTIPLSGSEASALILDPNVLSITPAFDESGELSVDKSAGLLNHKYWFNIVRKIPADSTVIEGEFKQV